MLDLEYEPVSQVIEKRYSFTVFLKANLISETDAAIVKSSVNDIKSGSVGNYDEFNAVLVKVLSKSQANDEDLKSLLICSAIKMSILNGESLDSLCSNKEIVNYLVPLLKNNELAPFVAYLLTIQLIKIGKINDGLINVISILPSLEPFFAVQLLKELVCIAEFRESIVLNNFDWICDLLINSSSKGLQYKYNVIFSIWTCLFIKRANLLFIKKANSVETLFSMAKDGVKEKVIRLAIASLVNLIKFTDDKVTLIKRYLINNGPEILLALSERKWSDDELKNDLTELLEILNDGEFSLTTFDEFENEVKIGKLSWSPVHKSQEFWIDNASKFKENGWKCLKELVLLLDNKTSDISKLYTNQLIVCHDLGMLIDVLPEVVKVLADWGVKTKIMTLMSSPDGKVKYQALKTTQLLVTKSL